jgi:biopolymer transport protein ExbD
MSTILILTALLLPQAAESSRRRMVVDVPESGIPVIAGATVDWKDLQATLRRHRAEGLRSIALRADGSVPFSTVQGFMAEARAAGFESVEFLSEKPMSAAKFAPVTGKTLRIRVREGARGPEIVVLQESGAASIDELRGRLKPLEKTPVIIDADHEIPFGTVQEIVSACAHEGFDQVSFAAAVRKAGAIRVLYAEHAPRLEFRYLRNMLERSSAFTVDAVLATADPDYRGVLPAFPRDLGGYDVVLMGGQKELDEESRKRLVEFVRQGGGIVWMAPEERPDRWLGHALEAVCPVRLDHRVLLKGPLNLRLVKRETSLTDAFPWEGLSAMAHDLWKAERSGTGATVCLETSPVVDAAFLVTMPVEKGRSVYVGVSDTWTWRKHVGDHPHFAGFWTAALKWAAGKGASTPAK